MDESQAKNDIPNAESQEKKQIPSWKRQHEETRARQLLFADESVPSSASATAKQEESNPQEPFRTGLPIQSEEMTTNECKIDQIELTDTSAEVNTCDVLATFATTDSTVNSGSDVGNSNSSSCSHFSVESNASDLGEVSCESGFIGSTGPTLDITNDENTSSTVLKASSSEFYDCITCDIKEISIAENVCEKISSHENDSISITKLDDHSISAGYSLSTDNPTKIVEPENDTQLEIQQVSDIEPVNLISNGIEFPASVTSPVSTIANEQHPIAEEISIDDQLHLDEKILSDYVMDIETRLKESLQCRKKNTMLDKVRPDDSFFTGLDSSLKKNTAFVRRVKSFTANQMGTILNDLKQLNLTKYTSEVAAAIVEAKLKMTDVDAAVQLCVLFHHTYADFSSFLMENWQKVLAIKKDDKNINASKLRVDLRFYAECINYGVFTNREGLPLLGTVLTVLINMDKEEHNNVNIILNFCRHCGESFAGLVPTKIRKLSEQFKVTIPRSELLPKEKQRNVKVLLKDYFLSLSKHLVKVHQDLQAFHRQNKKILQTKGELNADRKAKQEKLDATVKRLKIAVESFAEQLDEPVAELPEDDLLKLDDEPAQGAGQVGSGTDDGFSSNLLWEDEEMRRFYEQLPDMWEYVPSLVKKATQEPQSQLSEDALDAEIAVEDVDGESGSKEELPPIFEDIDEPDQTTNVSNKIVLDAYLNVLQNCVNREMIDTASVDFVMKLNTKFNRKKLTKLLFNVPRIRLDLLPFYARLVANLYPVVPEIANDLALLLKHDFKYHVRKKDQINIESKIKNVRFIGELVKFRMYTKIEALYCVKVLLHDFTHHHIEMCCNLLETCGRFLFRHPETYQRTKVYLEQMMRKKCVMPMDARYATMIENVFFYVNPPESSTTAKKVRPPMHEFLRRLLYQDLVKSNTDKVLRLLRKFDWDQPEVCAYAVKCLAYAFNMKYYNISCLANLLAGLVMKEDFIGTLVVDAVLEDIRLGLEINLPKHNQRRIAMVKYFGELYNYRLVESSDVFKVLYLIVSFGVAFDFNEPSPYDPPENLLRIRLVCVLLDTCGQYFTNGVTKKKLDYFFIFFQNYFLFKYGHPYWTVENEKFPFGIETIFRETLTNLRPQIHMYANFEESQNAISDLHSQLIADQPDVYKMQQYLRTSESTEQESDYMETINEGDDENSHNTTTAEDSSKRAPSADISSGDEGTDQRGEDLDDDGDIFEPMEMENNSENMLMLSENQEEYVSPRKVVHIECQEDDEFLNSFDRMVSDNIHDRMRETVKPQQVDISVPLHIKSHTKKSYDQLQESKNDDELTTNFVLMLRKGNKPQYKTLSVPIDSELALNLKDQEEAERLEKERVKRLTLNINERLEEEDYQEMLMQSPKPMVMNLNRERRVKYQHPKGAPDADLIFGSKKPGKPPQPP